MIERAGDAAKRADVRFGQVGDRAVPPRDDDMVDMRRDQVARVLGERATAEQRAGLVRPEARRSSAGQDDPQDQDALSILTGTDFAAGTWLSRAWWPTGIRTLHSG